jgi:predicted ATPase/tRNA A-37 threonylcarbamoyl transferase component Bud32
MKLTAGSQFGRYEILGPLGSGGMGDVYRARDPRLAREIAIKTLPDQLSSDRERLGRFEQEARAASALNHPNIVTIYELGEIGSTCYLAMELVEGETLRAMLANGPLPLQKLIGIAAQVAEGLAKAHEAGIVHRDLKPENLMVSRDGYVKILDFGLAKLATPVEHEPSEMPTLLSPLTQPGTLLGTTAYMSPEQANGQPVDFRSDQFSFGAVLYEMATGRPAFRRNTATETLVAILREEPQLIRSFGQQLPAPLCWAAQRCLAKEPGDRYASTRDLARDLAALRDRVSDLSLQRLEPRPNNLPVQRTTFIGRDREVAAVRELLLREDGRLVTLTGPAGIGKTRLALQVAAETADRFPAGVFFLPLAAVSDAGLIASSIIQTLGVREGSGQTPLQALQEYLQSLRRTPILFVLDNLEHLITAAPLVAELLSIGPSLKMLVASRGALHAYGEQEFPVPPLAVPDSRSLPPLHSLSQFPAVALFLQRARAVRPGFELTEENAAAVAEICARLDGLPLAIELAAARLNLLSPSAIRARLASRLQLLTGGARDLPARQQTLRGAIDWSFELLQPAEQKLFRRLSVFVGGCTLEAAEAVCNTKADLGMDVIDGMASMVDKSLLRRAEREGGEPRLVMLETIREYGLEKLAASGEEALTLRAHAAYFLVLAEEVASGEAQAGATAWLDQFELEHDNFLAALEWLTQTGEADWGLRLGTSLFRFWEAREHPREGRDWLEKILKLPGASARNGARQRALFAAGVLAREQGDYGPAAALIEESLGIARELGDKSGIGIALNALASFARDHGDVEKAQTLFEASLEVWRGSGDPIAIARSLSNLANVAALRRDYAGAQRLYRECLAMFQQLADRTGIAWTLNCQGDVAREQGEASEARTFYEESLRAFRDLGDRRGIASVLADLGTLACDSDDHAAAHALYAESMRTFQEFGYKRGIARLLECFACSAAARSQAHRSLHLAGAAAALRQILGTPLSLLEQAKLEKCLEPARQALSDSEVAAAWMEGWSMPLDEAVRYALAAETL